MENKILYTYHYDGKVILCGELVILNEEDSVYWYSLVKNGSLRRPLFKSDIGKLYYEGPDSEMYECDHESYSMTLESPDMDYFIESIASRLQNDISKLEDQINEAKEKRDLFRSKKYEVKKETWEGINEDY